MRKYLTFIIICLFISSCDRENDLPEMEAKDESYSFVKIEYFVDDDSREFPSFDIPTITYSNGRNVEQTFPFDQWTIYPESSRFVPDDWDSFRLKGIEEIELFVPANIDEYNNIYIGNKKWEYNRDVQTQKADLSFTTNVNIPPKTVAIVKCRLFQKRYKANYKLFLKENQTKKEKIIEGIWTGTYIDYPKIEIQYSDL